MLTQRTQVGQVACGRWQGAGGRGQTDYSIVLPLPIWTLCKPKLSAGGSRGLRLAAVDATDASATGTDAATETSLVGGAWWCTRFICTFSSFSLFNFTLTDHLADSSSSPSSSSSSSSSVFPWVCNKKFHSCHFAWKMHATSKMHLPAHKLFTYLQCKKPPGCQDIMPHAPCCMPPLRLLYYFTLL